MLLGQKSFVPQYKKGKLRSKNIGVFLYRNPRGCRARGQEGQAVVAVQSPAHTARGPAPGRGSGPSANAACGFEGPRSGGGAGDYGTR